MSDTFEVLQLGNPKLRDISKPVSLPINRATQDIFSRLMDFVLQKQGMGIAASQVGILQRFFIMSSHPNARYPHAPEMPPTLIINPEIRSVSDNKEKDWEGCLSVPDFRALVPRHTDIEVRYTTVNNDIIQTRYSGFLARVFQHEYDHLDGLVFLDRIESTLDIMVESEWQKLRST